MRKPFDVLVEGRFLKSSGEGGAEETLAASIPQVTILQHFTARWQAASL
jgi:hypothetical protein